MLYEPPNRPAPIVRPWEIVAILIIGIAVLWWGIPAYFRAIAWAGDFAMRHGWL